MFVIIVRHYKGIHSATGGSLTAFYYPLCCIVLCPVNVILVCFSIWPDTSMFNRNPLCVAISAGGFASISALPWQDQLNQCFHRILFHTWSSHLAINFLEFVVQPKSSHRGVFWGGAQQARAPPKFIYLFIIFLIFNFFIFFNLFLKDIFLNIF